MRLTKTIILTCIACLIVSGCGKKQLTNVEYGNQHQILFIANGSEPQALDVHVATGSPDSHVINSIFEGLTTLDPKTVDPIPGVAQSWTISDDQLIYTFKIRSTAKWSNGDSVTAHDFVYSWKRALSPKMGNQYAYMMYYIAGAEDYLLGKNDNFESVGVKALNASTLQVTLKNPTPFFLQLLAHNTFFPVPQATIEAHGEMDNPVSNWTLPENIVSNGPFQLKRWQINNVIEVVKSPTYWDAQNVKLNGIHFLPIEDKQAEIRAFRSGQVHLTYTPQMAIEKIAVYEREHPELLHKDPGYSNYFYIINTERKPFNDVRVRKALAYAIDREAIVKRITKGGEIPAYNFVPPDDSGHKPKSHFKYDPEKAKQLLSEAGFPNGENFPSFEILYNTNDNHRKVALAIQQMWKQTLNIDAQLTNQEWKVYLATQQNQQYDVSRRGWIADYRDASNFYDLNLSYSGNNHTGWKSARYDELIQLAQTEIKPEARDALFQEANDILNEQMPIIPIYFNVDINVMQPNVKNWFPNVLQRHPYKYVYLDNGEL